MDQLSVRSTTVSRGYEYRYYISDGPTAASGLFLMHGFRETASCWQFMLPYLNKLPYRLIVLDLLGYSGTSKPRDPAAYAYHLMVRDMLDIADAENIQKIIPVGHDHGAGLAQRMYNHAPERVPALILLSVPYHPPNKKDPYNVVKLNDMSEVLVGYRIAEYWNFLTAPDAAGTMNTNLDRVWEIPHTNTSEEMKAIYCVPNAMREYLSDHSIPKVSLKPYAKDAALKAGWKAEFERGGLEAPLCWYTAHLQQVQAESDKHVADENMKVNVPVLYIGSDADAVCVPQMAEPAKKAGLVPDHTEHILGGVGHWPMYEQPKQTAEFIVSFLEKKIRG